MTIQPTNKIYLILLAVALAAMVVLFAYYKFIQLRQKRAILASLKELDDFLKFSHDRLNTISPHAHEYFNSLAGEAAKAYGKLHRMLDTLEERIQIVEELINQGLLDQAEDVLFSPLSFQNNSVSMVFQGSPLPDISPHEWEEELEELFQKVGLEISFASSNAKLTKMKRPDRPSTSHSLQLAGINVPRPPENE